MAYQLIDESSGIDHNVRKAERVFQYGDIDGSLACYLPKRFAASRFSDGSFGVWYGALEEGTSVAETSYRPPYIAPGDFKANAPIFQRRRMFKAELDSKRAADLRSLESPSLTSDDYADCQRLGIKAGSEAIELFLTPSAREPGGTCTPVFAATAIAADTLMYTYTLKFEPSSPRGVVIR